MEYGKTIFMFFIDYSKAFDCADHSRLWNTLRRMGVPEHLIILIKGLYTKQGAAVTTEYGNTEWFKQGCILSPSLFNMYSEYILRKEGLEDNVGIKVGGRTINNSRYADDTTVLTEDKEDMRKLIKTPKEDSEKAGLTLNLKMTKIILTGPLKEFIVEGTEMEIINYYTFLGSIITRDSYEHKKLTEELRWEDRQRQN
jgi:hypothetical protein